MMQLANLRARLDFYNKTIEFEGDFMLSDLKILRDTIRDWYEWRIIKSAYLMADPTLTVGTLIDATSNTPQSYIRWYKQESHTGSTAIY